MKHSRRSVWTLFFVVGLLLTLSIAITACGSGGERSLKLQHQRQKNRWLRAPAAEEPAAEPEVADEKTWPISDMTTSELLAFYDEVLPFTDELPLPEGPIGDGEIVIGFSQTGFNHPWRVEMIKSAQAGSRPASQCFSRGDRWECRYRQAK